MDLKMRDLVRWLIWCVGSSGSVVHFHLISSSAAGKKGLALLQFGEISYQLADAVKRTLVGNVGKTRGVSYV
jgi:hypothetical protein